METLKTAVVDIITLLATCHALRSKRNRLREDLQRGLRRRLRRDLSKGTMAYIETLARARRDTVDGTLLARCRSAAERCMRHALPYRELLNGILLHEPGSLQGLAAERHDLWRLAQLSILLGHGLDDLLDALADEPARDVRQLGARLRRRLRKAQLAYARTALAAKPRHGPWIQPARQAALAEIGPKGGSEARRLAAIEASTDGSLTVLRQGVDRPLTDLLLDWKLPGERVPGTTRPD